MRITEAAQRLGTSPRMLRYRESLGLLPAVRERPGTRRPASLPPRRPPRASSPPASSPPASSPPASSPPASSPPARAPRHRQFGAADLDAVSLGLQIERRYDVSPAALAFGMRVLCDPAVRAEMAELGRRIGRIQPPPARAIDFEKERALRLLSISDGGRPDPPRARQHSIARRGGPPVTPAAR